MMANCSPRPGLDPDLFFDPTRGEDVARICSGCPVTTCLADALARGEADGWWQATWLGLPDNPMVVAPARVRVTVASRHGHRGTYLHCTAGEDGGKCGPCREANRLYQAGYRDHGPVTARETIEQFQQMTIGA